MFSLSISKAKPFNPTENDTPISGSILQSKSAVETKMNNKALEVVEQSTEEKYKVATKERKKIKQELELQAIEDEAKKEKKKKVIVKLLASSTDDDVRFNAYLKYVDKYVLSSYAS